MRVSAKVSAVKVLPTPGGPLFYVSHAGEKGRDDRLEQEIDPASFALNKVCKTIIRPPLQICLCKGPDRSLLLLWDSDVIK